MAVRMEKIICTVLHEAYNRHVEDAMDTLAEGPEDLYKRPLYCSRNANLPPVPQAKVGCEQEYRWY